MSDPEVSNEPSWQQRPQTHRQSATEDGAFAHPFKQYEWMPEEPTLKRGRTSSNISKSKLSLRFVAETGTGRPGGPIRNLIRSHARRSNHTNQPISTKTLKSHKIGKLSTISQTANCRKHLEPEEELPIGWCTPIIRSPGKNTLDPFKLLPSKNPEDLTNQLINHYESTFRHSYTPVEPRNQWVSFAMSDPILLNAILFCSALNLSCFRGESSCPQGSYILGETIRMINKRMITNPKQMLSDSSIAAVACIASFEYIIGSVAGAKIHMDGLESMVNSRGGIEALRGSKATMNLTTWTDSAISILLEKKPRFERLDDYGKRMVSRDQYRSIDIRYETDLANITGNEYLTNETIGSYQSLFYLTGLKDVASFGLKPLPEMETFGEMVELMERRIARIIQTDDFQCSNSNSSNLCIFPLFGNASILHIYMFMRDMPRGLLFLNTISNRIRKLLEATDTQKLEMQYPEMMLWILVMGGFGGIGSPNRSWFAKMLGRACLSMGITGGKEIALALSEFLWSKLYLSRVTASFWNDVARVQGFDKGYELPRLKDHVSAAPFNAPPDIFG